MGNDRFSDSDIDVSSASRYGSGRLLYRIAVTQPIQTDRLYSISATRERAAGA